MPEYVHAHEYTCLGFHVQDMACMLKSEGNLLESAFFFQCYGPRDQTQIVRVGDKCLYPLNHIEFIPDGLVSFFH